MIKRSCTVKQKLKVIHRAMEFGVSFAAKEAKVHLSMVYRWIKDQSRLETIKNNFNVRRIGSGIKAILSCQVEKEILDWITDRNRRDLVVSFKLVQDYCLAKYPTVPFKFNTGWFTGFKKRNS